MMIVAIRVPPNHLDRNSPPATTEPLHGGGTHFEGSDSSGAVFKELEDARENYPTHVLLDMIYYILLLLLGGFDLEEEISQITSQIQHCVEFYSCCTTKMLRPAASNFKIFRDSSVTGIVKQF